MDLGFDIVGLVSISLAWFRYRGLGFDIVGVVSISWARFRYCGCGFDIDLEILVLILKAKAPKI